MGVDYRDLAQKIAETLADEGHTKSADPADVQAVAKRIRALIQEDNDNPIINISAAVGETITVVRQNDSQNNSCKTPRYSIESFS